MTLVLVSVALYLVSTGLLAAALRRDPSAPSDGWRGRVAARWTLAAMALLVLAFFGSKFVLELVLGYGV